MSIKEALRITPTHTRRPDGMAESFNAGMSLTETGGLRDFGPGSQVAQAEYAMTLTIRQTFWANPAQRETAAEVALRSLRQRIYADMLGLVQRVQQAASDGDRYEIVRLCGLMRSEMGL